MCRHWQTVGKKEGENLMMNNNEIGEMEIEIWLNRLPDACVMHLHAAIEANRRLRSKGSINREATTTLHRDMEATIQEVQDLKSWRRSAGDEARGFYHQFHNLRQAVKHSSLRTNLKLLCNGLITTIIKPLTTIIQD
ncbi:unnamed protein product [Lactuca saligna]|uniref:Uncharacterized protein n=1 Tax=Lactuca saligna TaxID=75948 RepID=A0AA35ZZW3_LACSI|nr:unnamed protein product [Lactuca saligna]